MRAIAALAVALLAACQSGERRATVPVKQELRPPRIAQFYGPAKLAKGERGLLCYGTENAVRVALSPPVEKLSPSLSRCIEIRPERTTRYVLTAEDAGGRKADGVLTVEVGPPLAKFTDIQVNATSLKPGETMTLCFKAEGAARVTGSPGRWLHGGRVADDCLIDQPHLTTTYRLTLVGAAGDARTERVTVTVE